MEQDYIEGKTFDKAVFTGKTMQGEYEDCTFINCDFSNANLSNVTFTGCLFSGCNLSLCKLVKTTFNDVKFKHCKMIGLQLDTCNPFMSFSFESCSLNHSSFYKLRIKKTVFKSCQLYEVDFSESDLTDSVFENCDFKGATFDNTILDKADLRTSYNYSIDPNMNRIRKAKFSLSSLPGLLDKYDITVDRSN
jgi:fluoroquinolone resistance protein